MPTIIGLSLERAQAVAAAAGWTLRVVNLDGQERAVTADVVKDRINVWVVKGVVTKIAGVG